MQQFCYCTKLGAKRAKLVQLMQKFVQRCLVRIYRNKRSRSATLDPKLIFWCVSFDLGAFGTVLLLHETWCKRAKLVQLMQKFVRRCLVRIFATNAPDPHHWTLNSCLGAFLSVQVHFGTVLLLHETWCKTRQTGEINAKVRATMSCSQRTLPIHTIGP